MIVAALVALAAWLVLAFGRGWFWLFRERDGALGRDDGEAWPSVVAVVPARNEAAGIASCVRSLLAQDYPGAFRVIVVDDQSDDGTAAVVRALNDPRLEVVDGAPHPSGWTGKLFAVSQGVTRAGDADWLWLTDADICHSSDNLRHLVARAEAGGAVLVSLMARLNCASFAEKLLVPAFVFFFAMLFPFAWVGNRRARTAAAAGGCMLVKRAALQAAGGPDAAGSIAAIRSEIIDDCALAKLMKRQGPIWLGLTDRADSIRPYPRIADIRAMVARSAYAQLGFSPLLLVGTILGMLLLFVGPLASLAAGGLAAILGISTWVVMTLCFQPILAFYRRSPLWGLVLPVSGVLYAAFTLDSAVQHWRGRGGMWKGRAQAISQ